MEPVYWKIEDVRHRKKVDGFRSLENQRRDQEADASDHDRMLENSESKRQTGSDQVRKKVEKLDSMDELLIQVNELYYSDKIHQPQLSKAHKCFITYILMLHTLEKAP